MARASEEGKRFGRTSRSCVMPMVFMARAAAPMLPGAKAHRTTRIRDSGPPAFILETGVQAAPLFQSDEKNDPMLGIAVRAARRAGASSTAPRATWIAAGNSQSGTMISSPK